MEEGKSRLSPPAARRGGRTASGRVVGSGGVDLFFLFELEDFMDGRLRNDVRDCEVRSSPVPPPLRPVEEDMRDEGAGGGVESERDTAGRVIVDTLGWRL